MKREGGAQSGVQLWGSWSLRSTTLDWSRPYVMGVLNVTPDSFSDGGRYTGLDAAVDAAARMVDAGADLIDVGGESTRPGADTVSQDEELERVLPVLEALSSRFETAFSIDTCKAEVARQAVAAGAEVVNDVSGGLFDAAMLDAVAALDCHYVCGHLRGQNIDEVHAQVESPSFEAVATELGARLEQMAPSLRVKTLLDPCLGFGKGLAANLELSRRAGQLSERHGLPVLIGPSRKRFLGELTGRDASGRDAATVGACLAAVQAGAHMLRVHDVASTVDALRVYLAVQEVAA